MDTRCTIMERKHLAIILEKKWQDKIIEIKITSDRLKLMKLASEGCVWNIILAYAPQAGCTTEEKGEFYDSLEQMVTSVPDKEEIVKGADLNGHVGDKRVGFEREHVENGYEQRHDEGEDVLRFAQAYNLGIVNRFFNKKEEHLITYKSGQRCSTIDYILTRRPNLESVKDCKVIPGESIAAQHRILVMEYRIRQNKRRKPRTRERQIRWWKIRNREGKDAYTASLFEKLESKDVQLDWKDIETILISTAKEVFGETSGKGAYNEK